MAVLEILYGNSRNFDDINIIEKLLETHNLEDVVWKFSNKTAEGIWLRYSCDSINKGCEDFLPVFS